MVFFENSGAIIKKGTKKMVDYPRGIEVIVGTYIINDKKEVLLFQSPKWQNEWTICGGHIEVGETIEEATKRETKEEIGVDVELIDTLAVGNFFAHPPKYKRDAHFIYIDSVAKIVQGELKLDMHEITNAKWFTVDKALQLEDISPSCKKGLEKLKIWFSKN